MTDRREVKAPPLENKVAERSVFLIAQLLPTGTFLPLTSRSKISVTISKFTSPVSFVG